MCLNDTGKTSRWSIHSRRNDACLGEIKWYSAWRQYCFFPFSDCVFNNSCLLDILDFIKQLRTARDKERSRTCAQQPHDAI